MTITINFEPM